ncbi:DNA-3-methyladenine glycosylase I [Levilactobacillus namurensis]|uniref:DNA-3-methyladenine glycosylase I n=1 Tax=Levilactobacillus namurensis TaxID=380393 RepID=UPI00222EB238|nr:DNA-3-methyladenine glycosylase I [Levilactobacillus namurensis]MCW3778783.1 DNA-3-methyladenine glycosylase I [Levilactobacillus namurensis]MDT7019356.1 DNA-3-methyladenine glycosylase I [Levilactobacillus namurensis]WNN66047.1 DNA-3-methyladenine glycosylase I [Levilactobacillus namurensis]
MTIAADDGRDWQTDGVQEYHAYFGTSTHDDHILFELMTVGVFQVGLSWQAAASKLPVFRRVFAGMAIPRVAQLDLEADVDRIAGDAQMIGNVRKIRATIQNARAIQQIQAEFGSFATYLWSFVHGTPLLLPVVTRDEIVNQSTIGSAVARDLKRRGCKFVGPVVTHMFLKAAGILRDEILDQTD